MSMDMLFMIDIFQQTKKPPRKAANVIRDFRDDLVDGPMLHEVL